MLVLNGPTGAAKKPWHQWYEEAHLSGFKAHKGVKVAPRLKVTRAAAKAIRATSGTVHRCRDRAPLIIASVAAY
jgi:hypothetical protein